MMTTKITSGITFDYSAYPGGEVEFTQAWLSESSFVEHLLQLRMTDDFGDKKQIGIKNAQQLTFFEAPAGESHVLDDSDFLLASKSELDIPNDLKKLDVWCLMEQTEKSSQWSVYPARIDGYISYLSSGQETVLGITVQGLLDDCHILTEQAKATAYCKCNSGGRVSDIVCMLKKRTVASD